MEKMHLIMCKQRCEESESIAVHCGGKVRNEGEYTLISRGMDMIILVTLFTLFIHLKKLHK